MASVAQGSKTSGAVGPPRSSSKRFVTRPTRSGLSSSHTLRQVRPRVAKRAARSRAADHAKLHPRDPLPHDIEVLRGLP